MPPFKAPSWATILILFLKFAVAVDSSTETNCSCGYYDSTTSDHYTDSIIVYFNETQTLPGDFIIESYENRYEKGWNTQFRQGAVAANVDIGNSSSTFEIETPQSLELYCNVTTPDHLVEGGGIRTSRQDIFFGTFRALFRGTQQWQGGSALSMMAFFNETQSWQIDNINPNEPTTAWVSMISHSEFPDRGLGANYTALQTDGIEPWNWTEYRVDWTRDEIRYYIGGNLYRSVTRAKDLLYPQTPAPIHLKHWSIGNFFSTQGPPAVRSLANVGWVRLFFNSSLTSNEDEEAFSTRCNLADACSINNMQLRGSSSTPHTATLKWKQAPQLSGKRTIPKALAYSSISATALVLLLAFLRHAPWNFVKKQASSFAKRRRYGTEWLPPIMTAADDGSIGGSQSQLFRVNPTTERPTPVETANTTRASSLTDLNYSIAFDPMPSIGNLAMWKGSQVAAPFETTWSGSAQGKMAKRLAGTSDENGKLSKIIVQSVSQTPNGENMQLHDPDRISESPATSEILREKEKSQTSSKEVSVEVVKAAGPPTPKAKVRVDYLAGLVAVACLLVTANHFCLTFAGAAINPDAYIHNKSEVWARKTVTSYFLNLNWIGPFLMTSTRFLVSTYLKSGNPRGLAEKTVGRPFRLLIPITVIAMLEYFFMDSGATLWLEYLASITWSTWPFTTVPQNFGNFISEILQLAYLIPNAAPQITFNYCTGVLWTIPVQLQGSWTTIMAVIMIREIKTPWKRFCFYAFCVIMHWYALSWGTYFYLAIMLADLEITYDWKKWLKTRPVVLWPLVTACALLTVGGLSMDMLTQWTGVNYAAYEYGVHPDLGSGRFIIQTPYFSYPQYYVPKLNGLIFSVAFQAFVELSPYAQKVLSVKLLTIIFPHIFTIYLIHGFIWWSLGSTLCVYLSIKGLAYTVNVGIVAVACYATLALAVPILTPVVETLGKNVTANIWRHAHEEPAPRRPTLYPFPEDLLVRIGRDENSTVTAQAGDAEKGHRRNSVL